MSLLCLVAYVVIGLLFTLLFWMCLIVGRGHNEERGYSQVHEPTYTYGTD